MATHSFETELAKKYKMTGALLLSYFDHWIKVAELRKDAEKFHDGRYWTYASTRELARVFDYIDKMKLWRTLQQLVEKGLIIKGNFNKFAWDKTVWYSLTDKYYQEVKELSQNDTALSQNDTALSQNDTALSQNDTTIPIQSTYSIPYKGDNKQTQTAKQVNEEADSRFPGTKYDQETYGKAMDAYSKYIGYPVEASSTEIVCGMVDDYGLESVLYGFKIAYKNNVRSLSYVERCAANYIPGEKKLPRRRHKNDVAAGVAEAQRILDGYSVLDEMFDNSEPKGVEIFGELGK